MADILVSENNIALRCVNNEERDMHLLLKWLSEPELLQWVYGEDAPWDIDKVIDKFAKKTMPESTLTACFIMQNDKEIGYIQYYPIAKDSYKFNSNDIYEKVRNGCGIDIFIGEPSLWGRGIGSHALDLMEKYLKNTAAAHLLCSDPASDNERALRFWKKAGFSPIDIIENYDDKNKKSILMMKII